MRSFTTWIGITSLAAAAVSLFTLPCLLFPNVFGLLLPLVGQAIKGLPPETYLRMIALCVFAICFFVAHWHFYSPTRLKRVVKNLRMVRKAIRKGLPPEDVDNSLTQEKENQLVELAMKLWVLGKYPPTGTLGESSADDSDDGEGQ